MEVSESSSFAPLAADVDPTIFAGADQDSRPGVVSNAVQRIFVAGKHGMNSNSLSNVFMGLDGKRHSRALQAGTQHYYRITCGSTVQTGTFMTASSPLGNTYGEPLPVDGSHPGAYNWPDLDPNDRSERVIDPVTGTLIRKISLPSDSSPFDAWWPTAGAFSLCSHVPISSTRGTYYVCYAPAAYTGTLISINTGTGEALPLTSIIVPWQSMGNDARLGCPWVTFDGTVGTQFYCVSSIGGKAVMLMGEWTGPVDAASSGFSQTAPNPLLHWTNLTPAPNDLAALLGGFDPLFTTTQQQNIPYFYISGQQKGKLVIRVEAQQDAMGWIVVFDPGNKQAIGSGGSGGIAAALPVWNAPATRWCSLHTLYGSGDNTPWVAAVLNNLPPYTTVFLGGPYRVQVSGQAGGAIGATDTSFAITPQSGIYEPLDPSPGPNEGNGYLMDAKPGDLFFLDKNGDGAFTYGVDEYIELVSKDPVSHTWTVRRANQMSSSPFYSGTGLTLWTTTAITAPAGTYLYAACRAESLAIAASATIWWNFEQDPHGQTIVMPATSGLTSPEVIEHTHTGGHAVARDDRIVMADNSCFIPNDTCWDSWTQTGAVPGLQTLGPTTHVNASPSFEGVTPAGASNVYQQHPSYEQVNAPAVEKTWFLDRMPLVWGGGVYGVSQLVAGTTSVYKVAQTSLHRQTLATVASCGVSLLRDISSPATGAQISDATPYTYCVANKPGECQPGSAAGDVFASCPGANYQFSGDPATTIRCAIYTLQSATSVDICIGDAWTYGQSVVQGGFSAEMRNGELNRVITQGFSHYHEPNSQYDSALPTPDGGWAMFLSTVTGAGSVYVAKIPPQPAVASTIRRDGFIPVTLVLTPPANLSGVNNAVVEFGYLENGGPSDYFCTSRRETCVKGNQAGNTYAFANDGTPGQPCAAGCSVQVPLIPSRVASFRVKYRDASNTVLGTGEAGFLMESGAVILSQPLGGLSSGVSVAVTPASASIMAGQTAQFTATVTGTANTAVTWSVSPLVGSISAAGLYTAPASVAGAQTVTVTATSAADPTRTATATVNISPAIVGFSPIRINAGGPAYTDTLGQFWSPDSSYTGGATWSVANGISNTATPTLYQTCRYGVFSYTFSVPNGSYTVKLKLAEVSMNGTGQRIFNVSINGTAVLSNFDIFASAGGALIALDRSFPVAVTGGQITIDFTNGPANSPMVNALEILPAITTAGTFVNANTATQGTWKGVYGSDGEAIPNNLTSYPAYAAVTFTGAAPFTWVLSTSDVRAPQNAAGRIASTWYAASKFRIDVNLTDGVAHQVALYCLDWDSTVRTETIDVLDAASQAVLDSRTIANFHNGIWLVWNLAGHVTLQVTRTGGANAVVSGLLFGGAPPPSGSATFITMDTTTQGTWKGAYGAAGAAIANNATNYPGYAQVTLTGQAPFTWSASTSDVRAMQEAAASDRIASTWYAGSSFNIELNLTDGLTHQVALYCLDWDGGGVRAETIDVLDAVTGKVLDSRPMASFSAGKYLVWNVSGHVSIRVTRTAGANAVVSGLLFG